MPKINHTECQQWGSLEIGILFADDMIRILCLDYKKPIKDFGAKWLLLRFSLEPMFPP